MSNVKLPTYIKSDFGSAIVPIEYSKAVSALKKCQTIDDAKQWDGRAEALAAWAKIYKHDEAGKEARRLRLHAYRKMGELAEKLRPTTVGQRAGANSLLVDHGLSKNKAQRALQISRASDDEFRKAVDAAKGIGPTAAAFKGRGKKVHFAPRSDMYSWLLGSNLGIGIPSMLSRLHKRTPREVADGLADHEWEKARAVALQIIEWFDEFESYLPKKINTGENDG